MGLQNQLSDVSSESILILMVVLIGKSARYLHSVFFTILRFFSPRFDSDNADSDNPFHEVVGSGLAGLVLLTEQLNLNRAFFYTNKSCDGVDGAGSDCVVCLNQLVEGDLVRKLACRHVFHKECFDGWLHHLNFNCPLCRSPMVPFEGVKTTRRRVTGDALGRGGRTVGHGGSRDPQTFSNLPSLVLHVALHFEEPSDAAIELEGVGHAEEEEDWIGCESYGNSR